MKKYTFKLLTLALVTSALISCKKNAEEAATKEAEVATEAKTTSEKYTVDVAASSIEWLGTKPTGTHNGTINIENGVFTTNNSAIESGTFLIDMKSIVNLDIESPEYNEKLVNHLKSADFFEVEKYPDAAFEVTGFEEKDNKTMLSGNLKLKEKKNNVTFPVMVTTEGDNITITSETFTIDRAKWDVKHQSKSFFSDLGDKFINDDIELKITVKAKKS